MKEKSGDDFISRLPDDVLQHVISLLPPRDAVRTGFLSTTWRDLWKAGLETMEKYGYVGVLLLVKYAFPHWFDVGFAFFFYPIKGASPSSLNHTSPLHLRSFVVLPICFGYLLFTSSS